MAEFTQALPFIIKHEGTTLYEDKETGERSRFGITQKLLVTLKYKVTDPNLLTMSEVSDVYSTVFWGPNKFVLLTSQPIANKVMDMTINMKYSWGIRCLQAALNMCGAQCAIDGIMGPHTLIITNQFTVLPSNEEKLLGELVIQSESYYKSIAKGPLAKNLKGWLTRAKDTGMDIDVNAFNTLRDGSKDKIVKG